MHSTPHFRGKCTYGGEAWSVADTTTERSCTGRKESEIATKRLGIASDFLLINLGAESLKITPTFHSPSICKRLSNCSCSMAKDCGVHGLPGSPVSWAHKKKG